MALKGTLKDFSVADIFQLIGQQQKSGSLYVRTKQREAHIVFDGGRVVFGTFKNNEEEFLLGTMLLRAGVITTEQLGQAIENQKVTMRSLGDILRGMGAITPTELGEFVSLQLKEVLFRIFRWKDGLYEFVPEQIRYNKAIIKPQSAEGVLMDGFRMIDEWPSIESKVGGPETVYRSLLDPGDLVNDAVGDDGVNDVLSAFGMDKEKAKSKPSLSPEDKNILKFFDGYRSLQEVIYLSRLGTFELSRIVASLLDRGLAIKVDQAGQTRIDSRLQVKESHTLGGWLKSNALFLVGLFLIAGSIPVVGLGTRSDYLVRRSSMKHAGLSKIMEENERLRITNLLELYRVEQGEYPTSLDDLRDPSFEAGWKYFLSGGRYSLSKK